MGGFFVVPSEPLHSITYPSLTGSLLLMSNWRKERITQTFSSCPREQNGTRPRGRGNPARDRLMRPFAYARGLGSLIYRRDIITSLHKFIAKHGYLRHRPSPPSWRSCWQSHSIWIKCSTYWWLHDHLFVRRYSGASTATAGGTTATMPSISGRDKSWSNNLRTPN